MRLSAQIDLAPEFVTNRNGSPALIARGEGTVLHRGTNGKVYEVLCESTEEFPSCKTLQGVWKRRRCPHRNRRERCGQPHQADQKGAATRAIVTTSTKHLVADIEGNKVRLSAVAAVAVPMEEEK